MARGLSGFNALWLVIGGEMIFYGLKTCDTCKKALKALQAAGHAPRVIDVRADGVPEVDLAAWLDRIGPDALVNTRSTTWRGLDAAEKARAGDAKGALALLRAHPTLMKRPLIVTENQIHLGWTKPVQEALLGTG